MNKGTIRFFSSKDSLRQSSILTLHFFSGHANAVSIQLVDVRNAVAKVIVRIFT